MSVVNIVAITGGLTRDPEVVTTKDGKTITNFSIASEGGWGENKWTNYFDCVAFSKLAGIIGNNLRKGSQITLAGRLRQDRWQDKTTQQNRSAVKIIADSVVFGAKSGTAQSGQSDSQSDQGDGGIPV